MTPKEKAEELYTHMFECVINPELTQLEMEVMAISCALIAIEEVLKYSKAHGFIALTQEYLEIKQEIENL
jgi:hypothetical protein